MAKPIEKGAGTRLAMTWQRYAAGKPQQKYGYGQ